MNELYNKWKATQMNWEDKDLLEKRATPLMKLKWQRTNQYVIKILEDEIVRKNEYLDFLDLGAGRGDFYKEIKNMVKKYTGIEPSEKMLTEEIIQPDFKLIHGVAEDFSEKECYDVCLLKEVLDHCFDPEKVIKNSYEALKNDGILIITLTNKEAYYKLLFKNWAKRLQEKHKDHLFNFSPKEVINIMKKIGFNIEKNISLNYLRLPDSIENLFRYIPIKASFFIMDIFDGIFRVFLKDKGGSFILVGRKKKFDDMNN